MSPLRDSDWERTIRQVLESTKAVLCFTVPTDIFATFYHIYFISHKNTFPCLYRKKRKLYIILRKGKTMQYLVLINPDYLKDTKITKHPENLPDKKKQSFLFNQFHSNPENWEKIKLTGYVGLFTWSDTKESLKEYILDKMGIQPECLTILSFSDAAKNIHY